MYCKQLNYQIKNLSDSISLNGLGDYQFNAMLFIFHLHQTHILDTVNLFIKNKFGLTIEYEQYEHSYYFIERIDIVIDSIYPVRFLPTDKGKRTCPPASGRQKLLYVPLQVSFKRDCWLPVQNRVQFFLEFKQRADD